jgi:F0F1-type ATP synthase membrane subunit c/vacuolar-type H+-ATPase subunit K
MDEQLQDDSQPPAEKQPEPPFGLGIGAGVALGVALGAALDNVAAGIAIGLIIGGGVSIIIQQQAKRKHKP